MKPPMIDSKVNSEFVETATGSHALVIGSSIAGMLAARVLSNHFERVTIVERDALPDGPEARKGTPQARHVHALMMRGREIMEGYFPGLSSELIEAGAVVLDAGSDVKWLTPGGWGVNFSSGLVALSFSRDLLDSIIRRRLKQFDNIHFIDRCTVTRLITDSSKKSVIGATISVARDGEERLSFQNIATSLVVDATGRGSRLPEWLQRLGYDRPQETVVNAHLGYATRLYKPPANMQAAWQALFVQAKPPQFTRAGLIFPIEGDRWIVTLGGGDRDYPPTEEPMFMDFARSLRSPLLAEALENAQPISPIYATRSTENRMRHYDALTRWPERLIAIGDGVCAFNPVYGQGMTTAAMGALKLDRCIRTHRDRVGSEDLKGLGRHFQRELAKIVQAPWMLATGEDYRYRGTEGGEPTAMNRFMHSYMDHVFELSTTNKTVRRRFLQVQQMLKTPAAMLRPGIAIRVLIHWLKNRKPKSADATVGRTARPQISTN